MAKEPTNTENENGISSLPYTVVKIEGESYQHPGMISSGTGFLYRIDTSSGPILTIATNKHVIDGLDHLRFHMPLADANGKRILGPADLKIVATANYPIFRHPDPDVDLALVAAGPIIDAMAKEGKTPYYLHLSKANFPPLWLSKKLSAFTNVIMIGFPNGLMDTANNLPISRRGILSTHYYADYNGSKNFVVDIAAFGGSSGSPVFAHFDGMSPTIDGWALGQTAVYLIGVLHSGPTLSAQGDVVPAPIPTSRQISKTSLMMHLGYCAKVELLKDFDPLVEAHLANEQ